MTSEEPGTASPLHRRLALAMLAILQNSLVGGLVYGWASIDRTLLIQEAKLDFDQTTSIFSYSTSIGMFSSLLMGPVLDVYGPRKCSVIAHLIGKFSGCNVGSLGRSTTHVSFHTIASTQSVLGVPFLQPQIRTGASFSPLSSLLLEVLAYNSALYIFATSSPTTNT